MPTVYHDAAMDVLDHLQDAELSKDEGMLGPSFRATLESADSAHGDEDHHTRIIVARALHEALPSPFNSLPFEWASHDMGPYSAARAHAGVYSYVDQPGRKVDDVRKLVDRAKEHLERVMADDAQPEPGTSGFQEGPRRRPRASGSEEE